MAPLISSISFLLATGTTGDYVRVKGLGHVKLRYITMLNMTDVCVVNADIVKENDVSYSLDIVNIVPRTDTIAAGYGVNWEGELEIDHQDLVVLFEDSPNVGCTAGDDLRVIIGYEPIMDCGKD